MRRFIKYTPGDRFKKRSGGPCRHQFTVIVDNKIEYLKCKLCDKLIKLKPKED